MPELPEVETVRQGIADHLIGRRFAAVEVHNPRSIRGQLGGEHELRALVEGRTVVDARRRGKYLWLRLAADGEPEDHALLIHLGMSGQVLLRQNIFEPHRHLRVAFTLDDGTQMWFVDQRMFGYVRAVDLAPDPHGGELIPDTMTHIAPDLLDPLLAPGTPGRARVVARIRKSRRGVKSILLDQEIVSGVGNIYADEALWRTRLHYARPAARLRRPQIEELLDAATDVMKEALLAGGTSFDELYVNVAGESGYFERYLAAYGREGEPCTRCGRLIVREVFQNRSSFHCPGCQRRPVTR